MGISPLVRKDGNLPLNVPTFPLDVLFRSLSFVFFLLPGLEISKLIWFFFHRVLPTFLTSTEIDIGFPVSGGFGCNRTESSFPLQSGFITSITWSVSAFFRRLSFTTGTNDTVSISHSYPASTVAVKCAVSPGKTCFSFCFAATYFLFSETERIFTPLPACAKSQVLFVQGVFPVFVNAR